MERNASGGLERTASVEDMVGNLWRLGRTPSQAEFEMFFSNIANVGSQQNLAAATMAQAQAGFPTAATALGEATNAEGGIPRVASIDFLRKLIMNQQAMPMAPGGGGPPISGMMPVMQGGAVSGGMHGAASFGAFAAPVAPTMPIAPTAVHVGGYAPAGVGIGAGVGAGMGLGMGGGEGVPATVVAGLMAPSPALMAPAAEPIKPVKPSAKKPAAKKQKTAGAAAPAERKGKGAAPVVASTALAGDFADDKSNYDSMDDLSDDDGDGEGGKSTDEVRRQRRMLSNRESARRSRRRKLDHVGTLEGQIAVHKADNLAVLERLQQTEQRMESVVRENAGLKAEMERLHAQLREATAGGKIMERSSSLQRITSAGNMVKSQLGGGDASPQIGGDDSPRGFVPFRSLQSYENLLSLQAQTR